MKKNLCEKYLSEFLIDLQDKLDDEKKIEEHFQNSIFDDEDQINQTSCNGLTLMHMNILGGELAHGLNPLIISIRQIVFTLHENDN